MMDVGGIDNVRAKTEPPWPLLGANRDRLSGHDRVVLIVGGLVLLLLLTITRFLTPDSRGFGTHEQLVMLSPCSFRSMTGLPCPSCGMTTSWAYYTRGDIGRAFFANPGGLLLGMLVTVVAPWVIASGIRGRWLLVQPSAFAAIAVASVVVITTLAGWVGRLNGSF